VIKYITFVIKLFVLKTETLFLRQLLYSRNILYIGHYYIALYYRPKFGSVEGWNSSFHPAKLFAYACNVSC